MGAGSGPPLSISHSRFRALFREWAGSGGGRRQPTPRGGTVIPAPGAATFPLRGVRWFIRKTPAARVTLLESFPRLISICPPVQWVPAELRDGTEFPPLAAAWVLASRQSCRPFHPRLHEARDQPWQTQHPPAEICRGRRLFLDGLRREGSLKGRLFLCSVFS